MVTLGIMVIFIIMASLDEVAHGFAIAGAIISSLMVAVFVFFIYLRYTRSGDDRQAYAMSESRGLAADVFGPHMETDDVDLLMFN